MIRFRLGQSWKHERHPAPKDAFGLEVEGVDLLAFASNESLDEVVPELLEGLTRLVQGERLAQLSLPDSNVELCLLRAGGEVVLTPVSLDRPAGTRRPPVTLELTELAEAAVRCARGLIQDLSDARPRAKLGALSKAAGALERAAKRPAALGPEVGSSYRAAAVGPLAFGFDLQDPAGAIGAFGGRSRAALAGLLAQGRVFLSREGESIWAAEGNPFLIALELSRQADDLARAAEAGRTAAAVKLADRGAPVKGLAPEAIARAMFELGLAMTFAFGALNPRHRKNPYLVELAARCREGLSHLRGPVAPPEAGRVAVAKGRKRGDAPLRSPGRVRRLRFVEAWKKSNLGGESAGELLLGPRGPVFSSLEMACGFAPEGQILFRHVATHGVAVDAPGRALLFSAERAEHHRPDATGARWIRSHDGLILGPRLLAREGFLLTTSPTGAAAGFSELTGRELWRLAPPRSTACHLSVQGHRILVATDSGLLYGLDLDTGHTRFRMRANLPFRGPTVAWGRFAAGIFGDGQACALFAMDAHRGDVEWARELPLAGASAPLPVGARVWVAGEREGRAQVLCYDRKGQRLWSRSLHLGSAPFSLIASGRAVVIASADGAAARIDSDGRVVWRLGGAGGRIARAITPKLRRGILLIPGETVRALDPQTGELLADVPGGPGLCGLEADARLRLYLLDTEGDLRALRLATHLAVVR